MSNKKTTTKAKPNNNEQSAKKAFSKKSIIITVIVAVIAIIAAIAITIALIPNNNETPSQIVPSKPETQVSGTDAAYQIGDDVLSIAEYNYYYYSAYEDIVGKFDGELLAAAGLDVSEDRVSFLHQYVEYQFITEYCSDDEYLLEAPINTWDDFFRTYAENTIKNTYPLVKLSQQDNSFSIPDDVYTELDKYMQAIKSDAEQSNVSLEKHLRNTYGIGASEEIVKEQFLNLQIADAYREHIIEQHGITEDEIDSVYQEFNDELDLFTYYAYPIAINAGLNIDGTFAESAIEVEGVDEYKTALANTKEVTQKLIDGIDNEEDYMQLIQKLSSAKGDRDYIASDATLYEDEKLDNLSIFYAESWLTSNDTQPGDAASISTDLGYVYLVYLVSREPSPEYTVDFRIIFTQPSDLIDSTAGMTDSQLEEARNKAQEVLNLYENSNKTEDDFALLAAEYSQDSYTQYKGGLYSSHSRGDGYQELDDWLFSEERQNGDTTIFDEPSGVCIFYFSKKNEPLWKDHSLSVLETRIIDDTIVGSGISTESTILDGYYYAGDQ